MHMSTHIKTVYMWTQMQTYTYCSVEWLTHWHPLIHRPQRLQIASSCLLWTAHTYYLGYNHLPFLFASPSGYTQEHLSIKVATNVHHMRANKRGILEIPYSALLFTLLIGRQISLLTWVMWWSEAGEGYSPFLFLNRPNTDYLKCGDGATDREAWCYRSVGSGWDFLFWNN